MFVPLQDARTSDESLNYANYQGSLQVVAHGQFLMALRGRFTASPLPLRPSPFALICSCLPQVACPDESKYCRDHTSSAAGDD